MKKERSLAGKWMQYGVLALIVHALAACSDNTPVPPPAGNGAQAQKAAPTPASAPVAATPAADAKLVVAFGDSLYAGYNLEQDEGLAPVLEQALVKRGIAAQVVNAGVSGDTSAAGLERLAFTLDGLPRKPDLMLVGLGGNDMLRGLSPRDTRANMGAILTELARRRIPVLLTGMVASPNMGPDYAAAFNAIYPDLAKRYDATLYPFMLNGVIGKRALLLPDGIHPNPKGVEVIVGRIAPLVGRALQDRAPEA
ncbi:MAG: arylesterase [Pseudomonadota bacterium]|jgi:acyl-CoA thioesterase-1